MSLRSARNLKGQNGPKQSKKILSCLISSKELFSSISLKEVFIIDLYNTNMSNRKNSTGTAMLLGGVIGAAVAILGAVGLYALTNNQSEEETIKAIRKKWSERKGKTQSGETKAGEI